MQKNHLFNQIYTLFRYQMPIMQLLLELKFNHALINARVLGELFAEFLLEQAITKPDIIIPMPLHKKRLQERGFNQALELARPIAKLLKVPIDVRSCERSQATQPQATLTHEQRQLNIKNAFKVKTDLTGLRIAVIDDVMTTGFTMAEFCKTLKESGVISIDVWCIARSCIK